MHQFLFVPTVILLNLPKHMQQPEFLPVLQLASVHAITYAAVQTMHAAAASAAAPAWEDESGLEDIDLDQLVSQHRSRQSPPVLPEAQPAPFPQHHNSQQRVVRPAAAAAAAVVRGSALPTSAPSVLPQHMLSRSHGQSPCASSEPATQKYSSPALDLPAVKERLLEVMEQLLDADLGEQKSMLQKEHKHLRELRAKLEAEPQYGQPPPEASMGPSSAFQSSAQRAPCGTVAPAPTPYSNQPVYYQLQSSSWQPSTARQPLPMANQGTARHTNDVWDTAGGRTQGGSSWGQQGSGPPAQGGSSSFAYDAPDPAPRDDMGMPEPDPSLRMGLSGEPEGFVTCHQHDGLVDKRWDKSFQWSAEMQNVLERNFGTKAFRANQRQAINASLAGKDVFVLMPTGGGEQADKPT